MNLGNRESKIITNSNQDKIEKGFEVFTNSINDALNPLLEDKSQEPLKKNLDEAFNTLLNRKFSEKIGVIIECPDNEMMHVIQMAFAWYQDINSLEDAIEYLRLGLGTGLGVEHMNDIERISENQWKIKSKEALKEIGNKLTEHHRTLRFKR